MQSDTARTIKKYYAYAGDRRIHYRRAGAGPALVMLHASPGSSFTLEPLMASLARQRTVIALDTPGYGESTGLGLTEPRIADYASALAQTVDTLRFERFDLYAAHTGAKIALEFAARHPRHVRRLVLDGLATYTPEEQADMLEHYTPSLAPEWDGSHLVRTWMMRRDMYTFWPWYKRSSNARRLVDLPSPEMLHALVVDLLRAGPAYAEGPRAAIRYETLRSLDQLRVPTLIVATPTDALRSHLERMKTPPAGVQVRALEGAGSPVELLAERVRKFLADGDLPEAPAPVPVRRASGAVRRDYVATPVGQLLMRSTGGGAGRPLVLFHASPLSSARLEPLSLAMGTDRPVVTFDNPGNGDSPPVPGAPEIRDLTWVLAGAIDTLGLDEYDLYGSHTGALLAMELAMAYPNRVRRMILDGVPLLSQAENDERLAKYAPPIEIASDGRHMIWAWNFIRDQILWWPYYQRTAKGARVGVDLPTAEALHTSFVEFIKGGTTYHLNYRAVFRYPTRSQLPKVSTPTLFCANSLDPVRTYLSEAARLAPHNAVAISPGSGSTDAMAVTVDLYRRFLAGQPLPSAPAG